jgi:hypothetical protein
MGSLGSVKAAASMSFPSFLVESIMGYRVDDDIVAELIEQAELRKPHVPFHLLLLYDLRDARAELRSISMKQLDDMRDAYIALGYQRRIAAAARARRIVSSAETAPQSRFKPSPTPLSVPAVEGISGGVNFDSEDGD